MDLIDFLSQSGFRLLVNNFIHLIILYPESKIRKRLIAISGNSRKRKIP